MPPPQNEFANEHSGLEVNLLAKKNRTTSIPSANDEEQPNLDYAANAISIKPERPLSKSKDPSNLFHHDRNDKPSKPNRPIKLSDLLPTKRDIDRFKNMGYTTIE